MTLDELREEIDVLDANILQLLNQRAMCVLKIGQIKRENGNAVSVPERERAIRERLEHLNKGPLSNEIALSIFQNIIETMKSLQK